MQTAPDFLLLETIESAYAYRLSLAPTEAGYFAPPASLAAVSKLAQYPAHSLHMRRQDSQRLADAWSGCRDPLWAASSTSTQPVRLPESSARRLFRALLSPNGGLLEQPHVLVRSRLMTTGRLLAKAMPTFYFHIRDDSGTVKKDEEGADLADAKAARERAIQTGRQFLDQEVSADGLQLDDVAKFAIEVMDDAGQIILTVPFQDFLGEELKDSPTTDATLDETAEPLPRLRTAQ